MKTIKKILKFVILIIIIVAILILLYETNKGYYMYKKAIKETTISQKVKEIKEKENYTTLEEVPEIYLKAILAVEDHRFYEHNRDRFYFYNKSCFKGCKGIKTN